MMSTVSIFEEKNSNNKYDLKDKNAIKKIIFNGIEKTPNKLGEVFITNDLEEVLENKNTFVLSIKKKQTEEITSDLNKKITFEITDEENKRKNRTIFAIDEGDKYSLVVFNNNKMININEMSYEEEDLNFDYINPIKIYNNTFLSYENLYNFLNDNNLSEISSIENSDIYSRAYIYDSKKYPKRDKYIIYIINNTQQNRDKLYCNLLEDSTIAGKTYKLGKTLISNEDFLNPHKIEDETYLTKMNIFARQLNDPRME